MLRTAYHAGFNCIHQPARFRFLSSNSKAAVLSPKLGKTALLCCDIQEKFRPLIHQYPNVIFTANKMIEAGKALNLPLLTCEQYPKALGKTVHELNVEHCDFYCEKTQFSMLTSAMESYLDKHAHLESVILFGIEAHVCVLNTALDFIRKGKHRVYVLADGVSSTTAQEIPIALQRMRDAGCVISTSESILFELVNDAKHKDFKAMQKLVIETQKSPQHNGLLKNNSFKHGFSILQYSNSRNRQYTDHKNQNSEGCACK